MQKADDFFSETERLGFRFLEDSADGNAARPSARPPQLAARASDGSGKNRLTAAPPVSMLLTPLF